MRRTEGPLAPRISPPDLPAALFDAPAPTRGSDLFQARIAELSEATDAAHATLTECEIGPSALERLAIEGAALVDVDLTDLRVTAVAARSARWRRVRWTGGRIGTLDLAQSDLEEVELRGIRIDYLSLGGATVSDLLLADCTIGTLDLPQATLSRVAVTGTRVDEIDTRGVRAADVDLRGCEALGVTDPLALRGVTLSARQVEMLAPAFAAAVGVDLRD